MPFLLCNILLAFPLFFPTFSLVFCTSPYFLCVKILLMLTFMQVVSAGFFLCFHQWVLFPKTTCCFHQNDVLFSSKRRVVFTKTTCCFHQNDVLFSSKRRVVFCARSDVKKPQRETQSISQDFELYKYLYSPLSRARVHVHYRSFYLFAVTSVTL